MTSSKCARFSFSSYHINILYQYKVSAKLSYKPTSFYPNHYPSLFTGLNTKLPHYRKVHGKSEKNIIYCTQSTTTVSYFTHKHTHFINWKHNMQMCQQYTNCWSPLSPLLDKYVDTFISSQENEPHD
jgi:hypothetical protein